jgi:hypothetical protein
MKKKLRLARLTIVHLTSTDLQRAVGGVGGQQSRLIGTVWEPCQKTIDYSCPDACVTRL